jgi:hypothetical protein
MPRPFPPTVGTGFQHSRWATQGWTREELGEVLDRHIKLKSRSHWLLILIVMDVLLLQISFDIVNDTVHPYSLALPAPHVTFTLHH